MCSADCSTRYPSAADKLGDRRDARRAADDPDVPAKPFDSNSRAGRSGSL
jgi:hypothetical protein